ncbi:MAG: hypothetical protein AAFV33_10700 [Chloroflexota bacterium]
MDEKEMIQLALEAMSDDDRIEALAKQFRTLSSETVEMMVWRYTERCGATESCATLLYKLLKINNDELINSYAANWRDD